MDFNEHLKKYLSEDEINKLVSSFDQPSYHAAILNPKKMNDEEFLELFPHVISHPITKHAYLYDKNEYELGKSIYHFLGCFYLQEPSAMIPSSILDFNKDDVVLDMCSAPGGKAIQASFKMEDQGIIISNDISKERCMATLDNVERLGIGNIIITNNDLSLLSHKYQNYFTKIILDAPCSGSGMFRKDTKMKDDWSYNKVLKFASIQKELILLAFDMLKEGGEMVYSTCSYSFEEDEEVIKYLLDNRDAEIVPIIYDNLYISNKLPLGVHTFPFMFKGEGHYICHIKKKGNLVYFKQEPIKERPNYVSSLFISDDLNHFEKYGDALFAINKNIKLPLFNIIRYGVKIGKFNKDVFKYDHHYSHFLKKFNNEIDIDENNIKKYLHGESLTHTCTRGYILVKTNRRALGFGKSDGLIIKNHLPKRLRK